MGDRRTLQGPEVDLVTVEAGGDVEQEPLEDERRDRDLRVELGDGRSLRFRDGEGLVADRGGQQADHPLLRDPVEEGRPLHRLDRFAGHAVAAGESVPGHRVDGPVDVGSFGSEGQRLHSAPRSRSSSSVARISGLTTSASTP